MKSISTLVAIGLFFVNGMAGELFVKVNQTGSFYATYGTQVQYNQTGIFRFFDLPASNGQLIIQNQNTGQMIANVSVFVPVNQRKIGQIGWNGQFQLIQTEQVSYINWYTQYTQAENQFPFPPQPNGNGCNLPTNSGWNQLNEKDFQRFVDQLKNESFDNTRLKSAKQFAKNNRLSADQVKAVTETFSFDSNRLEWAKYAYDYCYNPGSYFVLRPAFTFASYYNDLQDYIAKK